MNSKSIQWNNAEVTVNFTYYKGWAGSWNEPPEAPEYEIQSVMYKGVNVWPLFSDEDDEKIIELLEAERA